MQCSSYLNIAVIDFIEPQENIFAQNLYSKAKFPLLPTVCPNDLATSTLNPMLNRFGNLFCMDELITDIL